MSEPSDSTVHEAAQIPPKWKRLLILFWEFFKISLLVIGGGYAIIRAVEDVFENRLRWIRRGDVLDNLPMIQSVPGLIAGNSAMYVGWRIAGNLGAFVSLFAIALPSFIIVTFISFGFQWIPADNPYVHGAFNGVRAALAAVVLSTVIRSWKRIMCSLYAWIMMISTVVGIQFVSLNAAWFLILGIAIGVVISAYAIITARAKLSAEPESTENGKRSPALPCDYDRNSGDEAIAESRAAISEAASNKGIERRNA